jgi:preprotein translocase subunit SecD
VNRFPTWKYALVAIVVALGLIYTLPNFFGESPAVQVSSAQGDRQGRRRVLGASRTP